MVLYKAQYFNAFQFFSNEPLTVYGPVTEEVSLLNPKPYLTEDPFVLLQNGKFHRIPWVTGVVSDEGIFRVSRKKTI